MSKADWYSALNDYGIVYSGKYGEINDSYEDELSQYNDDNINIKIDMTINININDNTNNTTADNTSITITDQEFPNKRELYQHYGIDIATVLHGYEIKMRYVKTQGKMGRLYKLAKEWDKYRLY